MRWFAIAAIIFGWGIWRQTGVAPPSVSLEDAQKHLPAMAALTPAAIPAQPSPWETVAKPPQTIETAASSPAPAAVVEPGHVAEALQTELKRLGCYGGNIDNRWGRGSGAAMRHFIRTARLRLDRPAPNAAAVTALRAYASSGDCSAVLMAAPGVPPAAVTASTRVENPAAAPVEDDRSYLPPWMRNPPQNASGTTAARVSLKPRKNHRKAVAGVVRRDFTKTFSFGWPGN